MKVSLIVAMGQNRVIGKDMDIPWRLADDWKYVKEVTSGHAIIMGRRNFESIGRVLPNRRNIILTRDKHFSVDGAEIAHSMDQVWSMCKGEEEVFIFGGEQIYKTFLPYVEKMYITQIYHEFEGDTFFPDVDISKWIQVSVREGIVNDKNQYAHDFFVYEKALMPIYINDEWLVEVRAKEFGDVFLLDPSETTAKPISFDSKQEAMIYIDTQNKK